MQKLLPKQNEHQLNKKTVQGVQGHPPNQIVVIPLEALAAPFRITLQVKEIDQFPVKAAAAAFPLR